MKAINTFLLEDKSINIFCDMDGVIADWDLQFKNLTGMSADDYRKKHSEVKMWQTIAREKVRFWSDIPWMPDGRKLWSYIKGYKPTILSKPAMSSYSVEGKKIWIKKELGPRVPYILARDKTPYAKPNSILIDDQADNIEGWKKAGGIGILHKDAVSTIKKLNAILK